MTPPNLHDPSKTVEEPRIGISLDPYGPLSPRKKKTHVETRELKPEGIEMGEPLQCPEIEKGVPKTEEGT